MVHSQRVEHPEKWRKTCVMDGGYRFVDGKELFYLGEDPGEQTEIAAKHSDLVRTYRAFYDSWWPSVSKRSSEYSEHHLGDEHAQQQ